MGVEPFLISSSILGILAQRLVRQLCAKCKIPDVVSAKHFSELLLHESLRDKIVGKSTVFKANPDGCLHCQNTGYSGRTAIHEFLAIDDKVRPLIMDRANSSTIRNSSTSLKSLRADGAQKVLLGITSIDEVMRVTQEDLIE